MITTIDKFFLLSIYSMLFFLFINLWIIKSCKGVDPLSQAVPAFHYLPMSLWILKDDRRSVCHSRQQVVALRVSPDKVSSAGDVIIQWDVHKDCKRQYFCQLGAHKQVDNI